MLAPVFMAFIGQFLAGLWNLTKGDTFGSVAMGAYGLFWAMYWWFLEFAAPAMVTEYFTPVSAGGSGLGSAALVAACTKLGLNPLTQSAACIAETPGLIDPALQLVN